MERTLARIIGSIICLLIIFILNYAVNWCPDDPFYWYVKILINVVFGFYLYMIWWGFK